VLRYAGGKQDWLAAGLPRAGERARQVRVQDIVRTPVPTCRLDEQVCAVRERTRSAGWDTCIVVNDANVVLGRVHKVALAAPPATPVEVVMEAGPSTFRPHLPPREMVAYMYKHGIRTALITTADGELVGMLYREDAERALSHTT
jgi:CBS domain-containing protein